MKSVAVVILNYNGKQFLEQFLPTVISNSEEADIYVVDNASTDDSVDFLNINFPEIRVIVLSENKGYSGGYNEALLQIKNEFYVLLNSDVEVTPNWLKAPLSLLISDTTIGACQPKVLAFKQKDYFEYAGGAGGFIDSLGFPFCRGRIFDTLEKDEGQYDDTREVFWASGACLFLRSSVFHDLGGLDETFFAHMEEIDLCWRMKLEGHRVFYCSESHVFHVGGGTLDASNPKKTYLNFRNSLQMLSTNSQSKGRTTKILTRMGLDVVAITRFVLLGNWKHAMAVLKADIDFIRLRKASLLKRKTIKYNNTVNQVFDKSIVFQYFIRGIKYYKLLKF